jgi:hypothetical protein
MIWIHVLVTGSFLAKQTFLHAVELSVVCYYYYYYYYFFYFFFNGATIRHMNPTTSPARHQISLHPDVSSPIHAMFILQYFPKQTSSVEFSVAEAQASLQTTVSPPSHLRFEEGKTTDIRSA